MNKIKFTKMVASGNDFVVVEGLRAKGLGLRALAQSLCDRKYGVGADGLLVLEKSKVADLRMRIFNADGSQAQMCGNGARCVAYWHSAKRKGHSVKLKIETIAGIINAQVDKDIVKIKLTDPRGMKQDIPIKISGRLLHVNFINTGVPHVVIFVEGLENIDVTKLGREIRYHKAFAPKGTNVNFVEVLKPDKIKVRTYERGVEDETLACGTGSVASALITAFSLQGMADRLMRVRTKSGEALKICFIRKKDTFRNVWLEGKVKMVFEGEWKGGSL